jgi:hypothetical protein
VLRRQGGTFVAACSAGGVGTKEGGIVEATKEDYAALLQEREPAGPVGRGAPKRLRSGRCLCTRTRGRGIPGTSL